MGEHADPAWAGRCTLCGNGTVDPGEECDDGNREDGDACLSSCRRNVCGDGIVRAVVEECDDGNRRNNDECNNACVRCRGGAGAFSWDGNNHCYVRMSELATWEAAQQKCEEDKGHLVTFFVEAEAMAVTSRLGLMSAQGPHFIGLRDEAKNGTFTWVTGEPLDRSNLSGWHKGMSSARPAGSCLSQSGSNPWVGLSCTDGQAASICERPGWIVRKTDGHAYLPVYMKLSWDKAQDYCGRLGAHLVVVSDNEEHGFLLAAPLFGNYWLGASRTASDRAFKWTTGEPWGYAPFEAGNPNEPAASCIVMLEKLWRDRKCDTAYPFICERP